MHGGGKGGWWRCRKRRHGARAERGSGGEEGVRQRERERREQGGEVGGVSGLSRPLMESKR